LYDVEICDYTRSFGRAYGCVIEHVSKEEWDLVSRDFHDFNGKRRRKLGILSKEPESYTHEHWHKHEKHDHIIDIFNARRADAAWMVPGWNRENIPEMAERL
jgi:hypothetical protein